MRTTARGSGTSPRVRRPAAAAAGAAGGGREARRGIGEDVCERRSTSSASPNSIAVIALMSTSSSDATSTASARGGARAGGGARQNWADRGSRASRGCASHLRRAARPPVFPFNSGLLVLTPSARRPATLQLPSTSPRRTTAGTRASSRVLLRSRGGPVAAPRGGELPEHDGDELDSALTWHAMHGTTRRLSPAVRPRGACLKSAPASGATAETKIPRTAHGRVPSAGTQYGAAIRGLADHGEPSFDAVAAARAARSHHGRPTDRLALAPAAARPHQLGADGAAERRFDGGAGSRRRRPPSSPTRTSRRAPSRRRATHKVCAALGRLPSTSAELPGAACGGSIFVAHDASARTR